MTGRHASRLSARAAKELDGQPPEHGVAEGEVRASHGR